MRILVHDYSGHPFQVQLSRELARQGHDVLHLHCPSFKTGKGALDRSEDDPDGFAVEGVELGEDFEKYSPWKRWRQERRYARAFMARAVAFQPDVVISSNTPLFAQRLLLSGCRHAGLRFVFWQQDIYSLAMRDAARRRLPVVGSLVGERFVAMERAMTRASDSVVCISSDFEPVLRSWGLPEAKVHVIENWAPLDELPTRPRRNAWSEEHGLGDRTVLLYAGTLGLKHNPELLVQLARRFEDRDDVVIVVISEGLGADWLRQRVREQRLDNVQLLGFQPYDRFADVLASGDVLVVILEPDAGVFSVPSKVLSYHCAGRPLLAAVPSGNLAARLIARNRSGLVVDPADATALADAAEQLVGDAALRSELGGNARSYACQAFDITAIAARFHSVVAELVAA